jgi:hypothetical protein
MEWIGGTDEAKKLINELIKSGDLINYYSYDSNDIYIRNEYASNVDSEISV